MIQEIQGVVLTVLAVFGVTLTGLITLLFVILLIPFGFEVLATKDIETQIISRLLIANIRIYSFRMWPRRQPKKKPEKTKGRAKHKKTREPGEPTPAGRILSRLSIDLFAQVVRLLQRLWRSLRLRVRASGRFGAADPATTGLIYGAYEAVIRPFNFADTLQPCFDRSCLEGRVEVSGRVWPIGLLTDTLLFIFSKPVRRVWIPELKYLVSRR